MKKIILLCALSALVSTPAEARFIRVKLAKCWQTLEGCPPPPPPPPQCSGPNGDGDCGPEFDDDDWIEQAIEDGCIPIAEIDGMIEFDCSSIADL